MARFDRPFPDIYDDACDDVSSISTAAIISDVNRAGGFFARQPTSANKLGVDVILRRQDSDSVPETFLPNYSSGAAVSVSRSTSCSDSISTSSSLADIGSGVSSSGSASESTVRQASSRPHSASTMSNDSNISATSSSGSSACQTSTSARRLRLRHEATDDAVVMDDDQHCPVGRQPSSDDRQDNDADVGGEGDRSDEPEMISPWRPRLNQRRAAGRSERRYHTADTIRDMERRREMRDSAIHKRLSLNYGGTATATSSEPEAGASDDPTSPVRGVARTGSSENPSMTSAFSSDSLRSGRSSSGVSSTASLSRAPTAANAATGSGDISEETIDDVMTDVVDDVDDDDDADNYENQTARIEIPPRHVDGCSPDDNDQHLVARTTKLSRRSGQLLDNVATTGPRLDANKMASLPSRRLKPAIASLARSATERHQNFDKELALTSPALQAS